MMPKEGTWELTILDGKLDMENGYCFTAGDIDGDGKNEVFAGGKGALYWYRPDTFEKGRIDTGEFHVTVLLEDVDGDGIPELFVGREEDGKREKSMLVWYVPDRADLSAPWQRYIIDPCFGAHAHDLLFADIDGDGENELIAISCNKNPSGIYAYKRGASVREPWTKHTLHQGAFAEGLSVADLDGDGKLEMVNGPYWFKMPEEGPFAGLWTLNTFAPNYREMCRTAAVDITGSGRADIVITDSEYMDGSLSWFENRLTEDPENPWIEHKLEDGLVYSHSLDVKHDKTTGQTLIFLAEMDAGGWNAPYNYDARLMTYTTNDGGKTWDKELLYQGEGTHQAIMYDIDNDGEFEVVGKSCSQAVKSPKLQLWKKVKKRALNVTFRHRFLDRDKPNKTIEIMGADVDGDGRQDVVCGAFWYKNPSWQRFDIPGFFQVINHYDIDGDGRDEFIALKRFEKHPNDDYRGLFSGELWWIKPINPTEGQWEEHYIGEISGDWPHGSTIAPLLPNGKLALIACYHDSQKSGNPPEVFEIPDDPTVSPWNKRVFATVKYNEELVPCDIDNDGVLDVAAGQFWFKNNGDGTFTAYPTDLKAGAARIGVCDINGDGRADIIVGQEDLDYPNKKVPFSQLFWLENPEDPTQYPWKRHIIDTLRCAHSIGVADIDGDGEDEIIVGEHDPFWPYRSRCRLFAYKKANAMGTSWHRYLIDGRFEHHDGARIIEIEPGCLGIISHAWQDTIYVNMWEIVRGE